MPTMILAGLVATVLLAAVAGMVMPTPQPPPVIYVQVAPAEPPEQSTGCLPFLILLLVVLAALALR